MGRPASRLEQAIVASASNFEPSKRPPARPTQDEHPVVREAGPCLTPRVAKIRWCREESLMPLTRMFFVSAPCKSQVVDSMEERRFQSGNAVIEEGGPGDFFYVTGSGELEVRVQCPPRASRVS